MTWPTASLADIAEIATGSTPKTSVGENWGGEVPFITPSELGTTVPVTRGVRGLTPAGVKSARLVKAGSTLVCCIGSLGKTAMAGRDLVVNQQINVVTFDQRQVDARYGFYACARLAPALQKIAPATTLPIVNKSLFSRLEIPVPPLSEQRRIATILDKADALRQKRRQVIALLDGLSRAIFHKMFGEQLSRYEQVSLGRLIAISRIGLVRSSAELGSNMSTPYVRMDAIGRDGRLDLSDVQRTDVSEKDLSEYELRPGDFLLNTRNSRELVGKNAVFNGPRGMVYNNNILNLRFGSELLPEYLVGYLQTVAGKQALEERKAGTTSVYAIYQKTLETLAVPIPARERQVEYATAVKAVDQARELAVTTLAALNAVFASLQHRAFAGGLEKR